MSPLAAMERITMALSAYTFGYSDESELQAGMEKAFAADGVGGFEREYRLSDSDRIDFYWPETGIGVEAKIDHSLSALTRQVHRYMQHDAIRGLIVVSGKVRLLRLPERINDKPVHCHSLLGSVL